jgi:GNAT superfamily N-acetyltransferase
MNLVFEPLSTKSYDEAVALLKTVFGDEALEAAEAYLWCLNPTMPERKGQRFLKYWVGVDQDTGAIVATTGLYNLVTDPPDEAWLGWYSVAPGMRGKGLGRTTLEWTMDQARSAGFKKFRLWTSSLPAEEIAQVLYESIGLKIYRVEDNPGKWEVFYRGMDL